MLACVVTAVTRVTKSKEPETKISDVNDGYQATHTRGCVYSAKLSAGFHDRLSHNGQHRQRHAVANVSRAADGELLLLPTVRSCRSLLTKRLLLPRTYMKLLQALATSD